MTITDEKLVQNFLDGDEKALEALVERYLKPLYNFVYQFTGDSGAAQDIIQDVFVKMWRGISSFNPEKKFSTWIYTIAKNTTFDVLKKKKSIAFSQFETEEGKNYLMEKLIDPDFLPDKISQSRETKNVFAKAIGKLSEKYKVVLSLYYFNDLNFREIAEFLKEPINTIKSRHRRGIFLLKTVVASNSF